MEEAPKIYDELVDSFARGITTTEIIALRPSEKTQRRVRELLERNKSGELSVEEAQELDIFAVLESFMQMVKARARSYVDE